MNKLKAACFNLCNLYTDLIISFERGILLIRIEVFFVLDMCHGI